MAAHIIPRLRCCEAEYKTIIVSGNAHYTDEQTTAAWRLVCNKKAPDRVKRSEVLYYEYFCHVVSNKTIFIVRRVLALRILYSESKNLA